MDSNLKQKQQSINNCIYLYRDNSNFRKCSLKNLVNCNSYVTFYFKKKSNNNNNEAIKTIYYLYLENVDFSFSHKLFFIWLVTTVVINEYYTTTTIIRTCV